MLHLGIPDEGYLKKRFVLNKWDTFFLYIGKEGLLVEEYDTENICDDIQVTRLTIGYVFVAFFAGMGQQWKWYL